MIVVWLWDDLIHLSVRAFMMDVMVVQTHQTVRPSVLCVTALPVALRTVRITNHTQLSISLRIIHLSVRSSQKYRTIQKISHVQVLINVDGSSLGIMRVEALA